MVRVSPRSAGPGSRCPGSSRPAHTAELTGGVCAAATADWDVAVSLASANTASMEPARRRLRDVLMRTVRTRCDPLLTSGDAQVNRGCPAYRSVRCSRGRTARGTHLVLQPARHRVQAGRTRHAPAPLRPPPERPDAAVTSANADEPMRRTVHSRSDSPESISNMPGQGSCPLHSVITTVPASEVASAHLIVRPLLCLHQSTSSACTAIVRPATGYSNAAAPMT